VEPPILARASSVPSEVAALMEVLAKGKAC
jgi:hypothetical protein